MRLKRFSLSGFIVLAAILLAWLAACGTSQPSETTGAKTDAESQVTEPTPDIEATVAAAVQFALGEQEATVAAAVQSAVIQCVPTG